MPAVEPLLLGWVGAVVPPWRSGQAASQAPSVGVTDVRRAMRRETLKVYPRQQPLLAHPPGLGGGQALANSQHPKTAHGCAGAGPRSEILWGAGAERFGSVRQPAPSGAPCGSWPCGSSARAPAATRGHNVPRVTPKAGGIGQRDKSKGRTGLAGAAGQLNETYPGSQL